MKKPYEREFIMAFLNNKIKQLHPGAPTLLNAYNVLSATVGDKKLFEGQLVDLDVVYAIGKAQAPTATTKRVGVVTHQAVHLNLDLASENQQFLPGEVVGICVNGFISVLANKEFDKSTPLKLESETNPVIKKDGAVVLSAVTNLVFTGKEESISYKDKGDFKVFEVEIK